MKSANKNKSNTAIPESARKSSGIVRDESGEKKSEFPGYPLYAPEEDIMNRGKRVDLDVDAADSVEKLNADLSKKLATGNAEEKLIKGKSELTKEDLEALGPKDLSLDMGEDEELLKHRVYPVDFTGKDIDVPGSELDDASEAIGSEDEENNTYSIGGDAHDNLEEDKS